LFVHQLSASGVKPGQLAAREHAAQSVYFDPLYRTEAPRPYEVLQLHSASPEQSTARAGEASALNTRSTRANGARRNTRRTMDALLRSVVGAELVVTGYDNFAARSQDLFAKAR
jgi:hypothetical protein